MALNASELLVPIAEIGGSTILHSVGSGLSKSGSTVRLILKGPEFASA